MSRRSKTEMEALDLKIRPLYEAGAGCRKIGSLLGENPVTILKRVRKLGVARSEDEASVLVTKLGSGVAPFTRAPHPQGLRQAAIGTAIRWFLDRGYMVSLPVEPCTYDLVVESDTGLQRVQIKTTTQQNRKAQWVASLSRKVYDPDIEGNAGGKRTATHYTSTDMDLFFIVTGDQTSYLVPLSVTQQRLMLTLDQRLDCFRCERGEMVDPPGSGPGPRKGV